MEKKKICIVDVQTDAYIYHNTPMPNSYVCLISGFWKEKGHTVFLNDVPIEGCINYIVADNEYGDLVVEDKLLKYPNTYGVGASFGEHSYYDAEWEKATPDLTIYESFYTKWLAKYPNYNPARLTSYTLTPFLIGDKKYIPAGEYLFLDKELTTSQIELLIESEGITNSIFLNPPIINDIEIFENLLILFKMTKVLRHADMKTQFIWDDNIQNNIDEYIRLWNGYKAGRMFIIRLIAEGDKLSVQEKIDLYNWIGKWRVNAGKAIKFYPANYSNNYREFTEFKRWTSSRAGYGKNSLIDYILYDASRDVANMADFLIDPYSYLEAGRQGSNKLNWVLHFFETADPKLIRTYCTSYKERGY